MRCAEERQLCCAIHILRLPMGMMATQNANIFFIAVLLGRAVAFIILRLLLPVALGGFALID